MTHRILVFADTPGVRQALRVIPPAMVCGLVAAEIRPQYHRELELLAADRRIPLLIQPRVTATPYPEFVRGVRRLAPDLMLVNSYSMLLREDVLSVPARGAINVHLALLPEYRGCNPIQWALLNDEAETGVTMHYMSPEFDTGDIIAQRRMPIFFTDTWCSILARLRDVTEGLLIEELPKVFAGTNARKPQDEARARYHKRRHPEDGQIDWDHSVRHIYNLIRALVRPNPGAFYQSRCGRVVLDQYLPVSAVAALKYGSGGERQLSRNGVTLVPVAPSNRESTMNDDVNGDNETVRFVIRFADEGVGACGLSAIDYSTGTARLWVEPSGGPGDSDRCAAAVVPLLMFAVEELGLRRVICQIGSGDEWLKKVLAAQSFVDEGGMGGPAPRGQHVWEYPSGDWVRHVGG
jgi:methionyl-tRNA formyltransferase